MVPNTNCLARSRFNRCKISGIEAPTIPATANKGAKIPNPNTLFISYHLSVVSYQQEIPLPTADNRKPQIRGLLDVLRDRMPTLNQSALLLLSGCNQYLLAVVRAYKYQEIR